MATRKEKQPVYAQMLLAHIPWECETDEFQRVADDPESQALEEACKVHDDEEFGSLAMQSDQFDHDLERLGVVF